MALTPSSSAFVNPPGANQLLQAAQHDDQPTVGPSGNKVQAGALALLGTHSALGSPDKSNPYGRQDG